MRPAGRGVPLRHDPGARPICGAAQRARRVHPVASACSSPASRRSRSTRRTPTAARSGPTTTGCQSISSPSRSSRWRARRRTGSGPIDVMNPHDDGVSLDIVRRLAHRRRPPDQPDRRPPGVAQPIRDRADGTARSGSGDTACCRFWTRTANRSRPVRGAIAPTDVFRAAVRAAKIGADQDIPHVSRSLIDKYVADLQRLDLV